jgi:hypothetical protein
MVNRWFTLAWYLTVTWASSINYTALRHLTSIINLILFVYRELWMSSYSTDEVHVDLASKAKAVPLQAWSGPEGSRNLKFSDFMTRAQNGGKVVGLTHRPPLPPGNTPGTHFCQRLSRPQGHSATGRIMSLKNSNDTVGNRSCDRQFVA